MNYIPAQAFILSLVPSVLVNNLLSKSDTIPLGFTPSEEYPLLCKATFKRER
jgi:hypothetical protein